MLKTQAKLDEKNGLRRHEWRSELEDLDRRLKGAPTAEQAEAALKSLMSSIAGASAAYREQIAAAKEALKEHWLTPLERTNLNNKIEVLDGELSQLVRDTRVRLAHAEAPAKDAKELDRSGRAGRSSRSGRRTWTPRCRSEFSHTSSHR